MLTIKFTKKMKKDWFTHPQDYITEITKAVYQPY